MGEHRDARRPSVPHLVGVLLAVAAMVLVTVFVLVGPPGPTPTAASESVPPPGADRKASPVPGLDRIVFYGHSMPIGGGASDPSRGYAEVAADATGLRLLNRAEGGTIAATTANAMLAFPVADQRDAVVVHTGMNDIFRRGDDAVSMGREAVERLLAGSVGAGRRVLVLECQPGSWLDTPPQRDLQAPYEAWNAMLREEARAAGVDVLDTCAVWEPAGFTDMPKYHPNDTGHALIAEELVALLRER